MEQARPQRKSPRLKDYDYSQDGAYFVTICTFRREHLFGDVPDGRMHLSRPGQIAHDQWLTIPDHHPSIELDLFVVMPNHVHGILVIDNHSGVSVGLRRASAANSRPRFPTLSSVIGSYKSAVTRRIKQVLGLAAPPIWQASFHDHIIRNERELEAIRQYIDANPSQWEQDQFYA